MSVTEVNLQQLSQDSSSGYAVPSGAGNGWYTYQGPPVNLITPTPGKILVFRTNDGKYAKMEILSYYKDAQKILMHIQVNQGIIHLIISINQMKE